MHLALYSWPRATLKRDQESHAVAQRHSLGCYLPMPAMATPERSALPPLRRGKGCDRLTVLMALSRTFTGAQLKTVQEVITLARVVSLIFKEW